MSIILVAGATGDLGGRITRELVNAGAQVRVLVRPTSDQKAVGALQKTSVEVIRLQHWDIPSLTEACRGVTCVVSALAGLQDVIIEAQKMLLDAAVAAGVPRFIPSDFSLDFTRFSHGENRNLDLRRQFHQYLDEAPISATTIFNGAFMELLTGDMPMILFKQRFVLYWGNADHKMAFTTMNNTAAYTARAALDNNTPRFLRIAGDLVSPRDIREAVSRTTEQRFRLIRTGGQRLLGFIISMARKLAPAEKELYPAWQGMQYMHNMIDPRSAIEKLDNDRYTGLQWTTVDSLLRSHQPGQQPTN